MSIFRPKSNLLYPSDQLTNTDYHSQKQWWSSSQFKEALEDIQTFHKIYVTGEIEKNFSPQARAAMDTGTYYHTAILEPEVLTKECAVWDGIRKGKAYEEFLAKNEGKTIITAKDFEKANALIKATKADPSTLELLKEGEAEVSTFTNLEGVRVRVRADWMDYNRGFVLDLKSMSGNVRDQKSIKNKIDSMDYDLSAALYLDAFNVTLRKLGKPLVKDFYWSFASKDQVSCQVYKATPKMIQMGRVKYRKALEEIKKAQENNWVFKSEVIEVDPLPWGSDLWLTEENKALMVEPLPVKNTRKKKPAPEIDTEAEASDLL